MAGSKQHFIPQFLLRSFGRRKAKKTQVCVYPKDRSAFIAATDGVAAQRYFYSEPSEGEITLDDRITTYEDEVVLTLNGLAELPLGSTAPAEPLARVITHLIVRSDHSRRTFLGLGDHLAAAVDKFRDQDWTSRAIGLHSDAPTGKFEELLNEEIAKIPSAAALLANPRMRKQLRAMVRTQFAAMQPQLNEALDIVQVRLRNELPEQARRGQLKALEASLAPEARVKSLSQLTWRICAAGQNGAVLPDCVALVMIEGEVDVLPALFASKDSPLRAAFLPLSPDRLAIGVAPGVEIAAPANWNEVAARASIDFFIGPDRDEDLNRLRTDIGRTSARFIEQQALSALDIQPEELFEERTERRPK